MDRFSPKQKQQDILTRDPKLKITKRKKGQLTLNVQDIFYSNKYYTLNIVLDMDKLTNGIGVDPKAIVCNPEVINKIRMCK